MSEIIKVLPPHVAAQIAAGEVVSRPASVVKELIENSVDAGATSIQIILLDAGKTSIQVIDNGCGMSQTDALLAFQRHATSKISDSEDLYSLSTFGFRGEALASIAAVAQIELTTRQRGAEIGTKVLIEGGEVMSKEAAACPEGTSFTVKNLFYNVPARRRFLKQDSKEYSHILAEVERVALVHPEVAVQLYHQGKPIFVLGAQKLMERIESLFPTSVKRALIPVESATSLIEISGFCGNLSLTRKRGAEQFLFVNGRFMKHPYFHKAIMSVYEQFVPNGEQPVYFLYFKVPPHTIDVNVHPTKTEIKFSDESVLWSIIVAAVREAVGKVEAVPTIDFNGADIPSIPIYNGSAENVRQPGVKLNSDYNPFSSSSSNQGSHYSQREKARQLSQWEKLIDTATPKHTLSESPQEFLPLDYGIQEEVPELQLSCIQYDNRYIIAAVKQGVMIINQRRAQIRILYEQFAGELGEGCVNSQGLLFPEMFQLSVSDYETFQYLKEDFAILGFDISDMGHGAVSVLSVPSGLEDSDYEKVVKELISASREGEELEVEQRHQKMAFSMAKMAALKEEKQLSAAEMNYLVQKLLSARLPTHTPDGKLIYLLHTRGNIDKELL